MLRKKGIIFVLLAVIFSLALTPFTLANSSDAAATLDLSSGPAARDAGGTAPGKEALPEGVKKLDSILRGLLQAGPREQGLSPLQHYPVRGRFEQPPPDTAYVYIYLYEGASTEVIDSFAWNVDNRNDAAGIAVAWIYLDRLEALAAREEVRAVRFVLPPVTRAGSVTSEGDTLHRAALARSTFDADGTGIKIGVISGGVDNWTEARDSGDLPTGLTVLRNNIGGDEGTAMLEIIHDLAPGAQLYFHDHGSNILAFNDAVDALVTAGCQIIVDDVCFIEEPFFEDGVVAQHVAQVIANNQLLFFSAAGNAAANHYQGIFYKDTDPSLTEDWHDFSRGNSSFKDLYFRIEPGHTITVVLQWDDPWGGSANDYDLFLVSGSYSNVIAMSDTIQDGTVDPIEVIQYINNTASVLDARIWVQKYEGQNRTLEVYVYGASNYPADNIIPADSIFGHPAVPGVLAVGAINANNPNQIASYSSRGPVSIAFPEPETRAKPDLCGIDRVGVTGAGGFSTPFYGTSAAASHAAAVAALAWSAAPGTSASEIRQILLDTAVDKGSPGFDHTFGYGLADAYSAVEAIIGDQCIVITPTRPTGPSSGLPETNYTFTTAGSSCIQGHGVQYRFDWGDEDGTTPYSDWDSGCSAVKSWSSTGTYTVRAQARCVSDPFVQSSWSPGKTVTISTVIEFTPGNVNGDNYINVADAILVLRNIAGLEPLVENQVSAADVNGNGYVDIGDAILILRFIVGLISEFPVDQN